MVIFIAHIKGENIWQRFGPEDAPGGDVLDDGGDEAASGVHSHGDVARMVLADKSVHPTSQTNLFLHLNRFQKNLKTNWNKWPF